jgi:CBS domain containing-hemolysin-like protein
MHYDGGQAYYSDGTRVPEYSSEEGSAITGLGGSVEGYISIIVVFLGAVVSGGVALLWFAIVGYKKFNLGIFSRIIAFVSSIVYGYIVYTTFASGKPDLMIIVYANIPVVIFFIISYILSKLIGRMSKKTLLIYKFILMILLMILLSPLLQNTFQIVRYSFQSKAYLEWKMKTLREDCSSMKYSEKECREQNRELSKRIFYFNQGVSPEERVRLYH